MSVADKPTAPAPATKPEAGSPVPGILMALVLVTLIVLSWSGVSPTAPWAQGYDPFGHWWLSTIFAAFPIVVLLGTLAFFHMKAHYSAVLGLVTALLIAVGIFHMPVKMASITAIYGACYGLFPIGWIILNVIFLYRMTLETGRFKVLQESMTGITQDTRLQLLLIAF
ncbi:MAG: L-lactate permease, partial [Candidatus Sulfotelmatobacter sp.]